MSKTETKSDNFIAIEPYNKEEMKRHMSYQILPH
jgi:hypothetical protein